jgi:hypothetical protein
VVTKFEELRNKNLSLEIVILFTMTESVVSMFTQVKESFGIKFNLALLLHVLIQLVTALHVSIQVSKDVVALHVRLDAFG